MSKGGSTSSTVEVPEYIEKAARRNLTEADKIRRLGFIPEYGPTVAAFTPMQDAAFQSTAQAAGAFGLPGGGMSMQDISGGMPAPTTYAGGVRGYSSLPIYEQALEAFGQARPGQKRYAESFFIDPFTGAAGSNMQAPVDYTVVSTPGDLGGISAGGAGGGGVGVGGGGGGGGGGGDTFLGGDYLGGSEIAETSLINSDLTDDQFFDIFESGDGVPAVSVGSDGTTDSYVTDQDLYGAPGGFYGGSAANETALINSNLSDEDFWDTFEAGSPAGSGTGGLFIGGGADGVGNFGQVGDFFGGIGDALGITDYSGTGGGLLGGSNVTGPSINPTPTSTPTTFVNDYSDPATLAKFEADRAPGGIHYESSGSRRNELAAAAAVKAKDDTLAQVVDTSEVLNLAKSKNSAQQWLKENGYGNYDKDDATDALRSKVADIEKSQLQQGLKDGVVMENDRYSVYVNGQLVSSEKRSSEAKAKLKAATS
jgi:hypothetical protein